MDKNKYQVDENISKKQLSTKRKSKFLKLGVIFIIFLVIIGTIFLNNLSINNKIKQADDYIENNECNKASEIYKEINKESKYLSKVQECNYKNAKTFLENKDYENAYKLFLEIKDYKDSDKYYLEAYYDQAKLFIENKEYYKAINMLFNITDYEDSRTLLNDSKYNLLKNANVGDIVYLGEYEQDNNLENGKEPIEWIVLGKDNDDLLLISRYILKKMRFGSTYLWEKSEVREWLNNEFYNESFNEKELKYIQKMITSNNTQDMVFCLSSEEARLFFESDKDRIAEPTQKLIDDGFKLSSNNAGNWWTRSVSRASNGKGVVPVESNGNVRSAGTNELAPAEYTYVDIGVRPSISININSTSSEAKNMVIYGHDSNTGLDNEPNVRSSNSGSSSSSSGTNTRKSCNGGVGCRSGWHPCNPNSRTGYCASCCKN